MIDPTAPDFADTPVAPSRRRLRYRLASGTPQPCVSIVTPLWEPGPELRETADSVLGQSLQQFEWILVDDGSREAASLREMERCRERDARVHLVRLAQRSGPGLARNRGAERASAPFICLLDGDDLLEPTALETWMWFLASRPELAFCSGYSVGFGAEEYLWTRGFHDGSAFLEANLVDVTCLVRTAVYRSVGGFDEAERRGLEDWDFWIRCAATGHWGGTVPEYLSWYRRRADTGRWPNLAASGRQAYRAALRARHPSLDEGTFPEPVPGPGLAVSGIDAGTNRMRRHEPSLLVVEETMGDGPVDAWNLALVAGMCRQGWEVTVVATASCSHAGSAGMSRIAPDTFVLPRFLHPDVMPAFLDYLTSSRRFDVACVSRSELGHRLMPALTGRHLEVTWCSLEAGEWGAPTTAALPGAAPGPAGMLQRVRAAMHPSDPRQLRPVGMSAGRSVRAADPGGGHPAPMARSR